MHALSSRLTADPALSRAVLDAVCVGIHWTTEVVCNNNNSSNESVKDSSSVADDASVSSWAGSIGSAATYSNLNSNKLKVCQVFSSALPVAYSKSTPSKDWTVFASIILEAAFSGVLSAGHMMASAKGIAARVDVSNATTATTTTNTVPSQSVSPNEATDAEDSQNPAIPAEQTKPTESPHRVKVFLTPIGAGAFGNRVEWIINSLGKALERHRHAPLDVKLVHYGGVVKSAYNNINSTFHVPKPQMLYKDEKRASSKQFGSQAGHNSNNYNNNTEYKWVPLINSRFSNVFMAPQMPPQNHYQGPQDHIFQSHVGDANGYVISSSQGHLSHVMSDDMDDNFSLADGSIVSEINMQDDASVFSLDNGSVNDKRLKSSRKKRSKKKSSRNGASRSNKLLQMPMPVLMDHTGGMMDFDNCSIQSVTTAMTNTTFSSAAAWKKRKNIKKKKDAGNGSISSKYFVETYFPAQAALARQRIVDIDHTNVGVCGVSYHTSANPSRDHLQSRGKDLNLQFPVGTASNSRCGTAQIRPKTPKMPTSAAVAATSKSQNVTTLSWIRHIGKEGIKEAIREAIKEGANSNSRCVSPASPLFASTAPEPVQLPPPSPVAVIRSSTANGKSSINHHKNEHQVGTNKGLVGSLSLPSVSSNQHNNSLASSLFKHSGNAARAGSANNQVRKKSAMLQMVTDELR
jgi:hypothetical protein